jgi:hypothetical protein
VNGEGRETATMGIAVGDFTGSGRLGILDTDFSDDYKVLYRNNGKLTFSDVSVSSGIGLPSTPFLGWGDAFLDYDGDGLQDIFMANGHVYPQVDKHAWGTSLAERPLLFHNIDGKKFSLVEAVKGTGLALLLNARGAAFGDLFNEGKTDVVINNLEGPPTLLRNILQNNNHWIEFALTGGEHSPRDAIGAKIFITACGRKLRRDLLSGGSFASSSDPRLLFGIGTCADIDSAEITWPDGERQKIEHPQLDRILSVSQAQEPDKVFAQLEDEPIEN